MKLRPSYDSPMGGSDDMYEDDEFEGASQEDDDKVNVFDSDINVGEDTVDGQADANVALAENGRVPGGRSDQKSHKRNHSGAAVQTAIEPVNTNP